MHTVDNRLQIAAREVLVSILEVVDELVGPLTWTKMRWEYLNGTPTTVAYSNDHVDVVVISESLALLELLSPAETMRFLGVDKKARRYLCTTCRAADENQATDPMTAVLRPNEPNSTEVYCFVCDVATPVERRDCVTEDCPGNVIDTEADACLTCGWEQRNDSRGREEATAYN